MDLSTTYPQCLGVSFPPKIIFPVHVEKLLKRKARNRLRFSHIMTSLYTDKKPDQSG